MVLWTLYSISSAGKAISPVSYNLRKGSGFLFILLTLFLSFRFTTAVNRIYSVSQMEQCVLEVNPVVNILCSAFAAAQILWISIFLLVCGASALNDERGF